MINEAVQKLETAEIFDIIYRDEKVSVLGFFSCTFSKIELQVSSRINICYMEAEQEIEWCKSKMDSRAEKQKIINEKIMHVLNNFIKFFY